MPNGFGGLLLVGFEDGALKEPDAFARIGEGDASRMVAEGAGYGAADPTGEYAAVCFRYLVEQYHGVPVGETAMDMGDNFIL